MQSEAEHSLAKLSQEDLEAQEKEEKKIDQNALILRRSKTYQFGSSKKKHFVDTEDVQILMQSQKKD